MKPQCTPTSPPWIRAWKKLQAARLRLAAKVGARHGRLSRSLRWPLPWRSPWRWPDIRVRRLGGVGDQLMCIPALRLLKELNPKIRITFYTSLPDIFRGLPFLDEVLHESEFPHPSAIYDNGTAYAVNHRIVLDGHWGRAVQLAYEGSLPPRRHLASIQGDCLDLDVRDVRPACVVPEEKVRGYAEQWSGKPRPWIVVNRKAGYTTNKNWPDEYWESLVKRLLADCTVIEIGTSPDEGETPRAADNYVDLRGKTGITDLVAVLALADVQVGPVSGPMHIAAAVGTPSVVINGGYEDPVATRYPGNIDFFTQLPCSPCWMREPCPIDRECLRRIPPASVEEAVRRLAPSGPRTPQDPRSAAETADIMA